MERKKVAIVVPVYNEEKGLRHFHTVITNVFADHDNYEWKIIYINDGSIDSSETILEDICKKDKRAEGIILSRNFGKEIALTAGLDATDSDCAIFMDADLQHPPELIPEFLKEWENGSFVVASIRRKTEKKSFIKHIGSKMFYFFMTKISDVEIIPNTTDFKLLDRKVLDVLKKFTERNRMFRGLIDWMGFKTTFVEFDAAERYAGEYSYSIRKLARLAINSITSFSLFPLKLAGYLGIMTLLGSSIMLIVMLVVRIFINPNYFTSLSFIIVGNTTILGITLMALGLLALYIGRIHDEVINRPLYVIKNHTKGENASEEPHA